MSFKNPKPDGKHLDLQVLQRYFFFLVCRVESIKLYMLFEALLILYYFMISLHRITVCLHHCVSGITVHLQHYIVYTNTLCMFTTLIYI